MQAYPDIACGMFKGSKDELNRIWRNLEAELNSAGPPSKNITEWKRVWNDQKKYVRQKAAQNLKISKGTGGGPNMEVNFSANEYAIYNLIGMKESVEGVAKTFGLGSSSASKPAKENVPIASVDNTSGLGSSNGGIEEHVSPALLELLIVDSVVEGNDRESERESPQKPPAKKVKKNSQSELPRNVSHSEVLAEEITIQKKMLKTMIDTQQNTKKLYRAIDRLAEIKKDELKEQKRHNLVMEKLRISEVEDKIERNRRLLELEDLKYNI